MRTPWYELQIDVVIDGVNYFRDAIWISIRNHFWIHFWRCLTTACASCRDTQKTIFPNSTRTCFCYREWRETKGLMAQILNSSGSQQAPHENCCFLTFRDDFVNPRRYWNSFVASSFITQKELLISLNASAMKPKFDSNSPAKGSLEMRFHKFSALQLQHSWCVSLLWSQNRSQEDDKRERRWPLFAEDFYCGRPIHSVILQLQLGWCFWDANETVIDCEATQIFKIACDPSLSR